MSRHSPFTALLLPALLWCAAAAGGDVAQPDADRHTVLLLPMDEGSGGTTADASRQQLTAEIHGAQWNVGRFGYGLAFDGSGVYVDVPNAPGLCPEQAVTVEAWVKLENAKADTICKNLSYFMRIDGNLQAYFHVDGKWRILKGVAAVPLKRWTHVAMTYDGASRTMRTFVDGVPDAAEKLEGLTTYELGKSTEPLRVGRNTWRTTGGVVGKVDEVRISQAARSFEPLEPVAGKAASISVPNGSFECGRYGWRGSHESNSRLEWEIDSDNASHGRRSLRSTVMRPVTVITKPFALTRGPDYVLSVDAKADSPKRRVTLRLAAAGMPKKVQGYARGKGFTVGSGWQTLSLAIDGTEDCRSGSAYVSVGKHDGTLWVDNVRIRPVDAESGTEVPHETWGVRFATGRLGDTYFADTGPADAHVQVVNVGDAERTLGVRSRVIDFFGQTLSQTDHGRFELPAYEEAPIPFTVDTRRRGAFCVDFTVADADTGQSRLMSYRYNVILPLKAVGDAMASPFGMNTHMEREPVEHLSCNLEMLSQCGVKWIRGWWGWGMAEKQPGRFDWAEFERQYHLVTKSQMHLMPILLRYYPSYEQAWAGLVDTIQRPPYKLEQWGSFVSETVARFKGRVRVWEIWNEPGYSQGFTPESYAELAQTTYRQARRADSECRLIGFAGVPTSFMAKAAAAGALAAMDIVGEHSYGQLARPETAMLERCSEVRSLLAEHGKPMPIWHTEQGTGADGDGYVAGLLTEQECASALVRGYVCALAAGVEKFFWFSAQTSPTYGWAVFYEDYVPRPRLVALNGLASRLEGAVFHTSLKLGDDAEAYVFQKGQDAVAVVWGRAWPVALHASSVQPEVKVIDMMGNVRSHVRGGAEMDVSLRPTLPVYLVYTSAKARHVAECLRNMNLTEEAFAEIGIAGSGADAIAVRITSRAPGALDALVTVSCEPPLRFGNARRFVHDLEPGKPCSASFRYEPDAAAMPRVVTATVEAGPFRLRTAEVRAELEL